MPIHIYHPNRNNTGFACAFSQSDKDGTIFASILKQSGWDAEKSTGSFKDSKNDPTKNVNGSRKPGMVNRHRPKGR